MGTNHNLALALLVIFMAVAAPAFAKAGLTEHSLRMNTQQGTKLTAAAHGAMGSADPKGLVMGEYVWTKKEYRERALEAFFKSLAESYRKDGGDENLRVSVPIILLIDVDGYYVNYNALFDWSSIKDLSDMDDFESPMQMGSLIAWGETRNGYYIRYYLTDYVQVTDTSLGICYKGDRHDVAASLRADGAPAGITGYLDGTEHKTNRGEDLGEAFTINREERIVGSAEEMIRVYVNQYNYSAGRNGGGYDLTMPTVKGEDWHRMLDNPTLLCFMQGRNVQNSKEVINTYAYAGGEVFKGDRYFITETGGTHAVLKGREAVGTDTNRVYHSYSEAYQRGEITEGADGQLIFSGHVTAVEIDRLYFTMGDCAAEGAVPCPDCIK